MKPRHLLMSTGLLLTGGLLMFGDHDVAADLAQPMAREKPALGPTQAMPAPTLSAEPDRVADKAGAVNPASGDRGDKADAARDPLLVLLDRAAMLDATHAGRRSEQMFSAHSWAPPAPVKPVAVAATAPAVPRAPPLPFSYIGKQSNGGAVEIFLAQGEKTLVVHEGSLIDGAYRVDAIGPVEVLFTYLPLNQIQQLAIRGTD
ncbi:hypothetical protein LNV08_09105 [Paucibacter sp. TC2R-5]|uniref:hypothetical protein n=1 Tax=Paucibacter sp. TC2R-5 TaxID=2893555 RepID=UPI0021E3D8FD|nr:hypothetical protein [Paucibacter sp. TC2R-5]MCV2359133.1 hypothetical protein [Paucibacter sp. TC2R-5]